MEGRLHLRRLRAALLRQRETRAAFDAARHRLHTLASRLHHSRRRIRRVALASSLSLVAAACLTLLIAYGLVRSVPSWWRAVQRDHPTTIATGTRVENAVLNRLSKVRETPDGLVSDPWTIALKPDEANAWLNARLPRWLANQNDEFRWPKDLNSLQVNFSPSRVTIGALVHTSGHDQVLTATLEPRLDSRGRLYLHARSISVGRLSFPATWVLDDKTAGQYLPRDIRDLPETRALLHALSSGDAVVQQALFRLSDGRRVRILDISPEDGILRITCQTEMQ
jgi:hypothetical protein